MEYSRLIMTLPKESADKYVGREVLGYIIKDDNVITCESDILNSRYPNIRVVEGKLIKYNEDDFRKCFTVEVELGDGFKSIYKCDMIRIKKIEEKKHFVGKEAEALNNAIIAATESLNMFTCKEVSYCDIQIQGDSYGLDKNSCLEVSRKVRRDGSEVYTYSYSKKGESFKSTNSLARITVEAAITKDKEPYIVTTNVVGREDMEKDLPLNMHRAVKALFSKN